jgi:hypothetical protein
MVAKNDLLCLLSLHKLRTSVNFKDKKAPTIGTSTI